MRWLVNYIRSCFCTHDWEFICQGYESDVFFGERRYFRVYRCKKCGCFKKYKV